MTYRGGTGHRRGRRRRIQASNAGKPEHQYQLGQLIFSLPVCRRITARVEWRARRDTTWNRSACLSREAW
jgi:hypothetical protein